MVYFSSSFLSLTKVSPCCNTMDFDRCTTEHFIREVFINFAGRDMGKQSFLTVVPLIKCGNKRIAVDTVPV